MDANIITLLFQLCAMILTFGIGAVAAYGVMKAKFTQVHNFFHLFDEALKDDNITAEEFQSIVSSARKVLGL